MLLYTFLYAFCPSLLLLLPEGTKRQAIEARNKRRNLPFFQTYVNARGAESLGDKNTIWIIPPSKRSAMSEYVCYADLFRVYQSEMAEWLVQTVSRNELNSVANYKGGKQTHYTMK